GLGECLERPPKLTKARIRVLTVPGRRAIDPVKDRGDLDDLAPNFEEVVLENFGRIACVEHRSVPSLISPILSPNMSDRTTPRKPSSAHERLRDLPNPPDAPM